MRLLPLVALLLTLPSCTKVSPAQRKHAEELSAQASQAMHREDFAEAIRLLDAAVQANPEFAEAWCGKGLAAAALGDTETAKAAHETALRIYIARQQTAPDQTNDIEQEVFELIILGRTAEAQSRLQEALTKEPENARLKGFSTSLPSIISGMSKSKFRLAQKAAK